MQHRTQPEYTQQNTLSAVRPQKLSALFLLTFALFTAGPVVQAAELNSKSIVTSILRGDSLESDQVREIVDSAESDSWDARQCLEIGEAFEQTRQWVNAIRVYEASLKKHDEDADLTYALRRTRVHFGIDRRYTDESFKNRMLLSGRSESLDLMEDVMRRVQVEYVDRVSSTHFVAHGTESLYMALGNERFLKSHNIRKHQKNATKKVRDTLVKSYWNRRVSNRIDARMAVAEVCDLCRRELNLPASAIVMEYLFGGCNALDDYSNFLTPSRYDDLFGSIHGEFVGIGIEMEGEKGKGMHLVNVLLDSPAEAGGLRPGDYIVEVDGTDCRDMTSDEAAQLLRGPRGSSVNLVFQSPDGGRSQAKLTRRAVQVRSVTRKLILDNARGIGYIRMEGFQNSTTDELDRALRELEDQGMKSLIWDLRDNPGGLLETAAAVIDRFIDNGVLVSTEGRSPDQNQVFHARSSNTRNIPLVLLVNENSASASEIVAGAINDHKRGQIVGRRTYGKWSVQSIIHLPGGTGLKLTTAKFFSPAHRNYAGKGINPHIAVPQVRRTYFRGRTSDEIKTDPDVERAVEILEKQIARK